LPLVFISSLCGLGAEEKPPALRRLSPGEFDRAAAAHLLSRAGFGGTPQEIDALAALGLEKAVESLLDPSAPSPFEEFQPAVTERPSRRELIFLGEAERKQRIAQYRRADFFQFQRLRAWWFRRMVLTRRPLEEKMTLFWHGHFATAERDVKNSYHMYLQNRTLRSLALGSFRDLTRAVAKDPAMLEYLDNNQNHWRRPNENLARELMELFTLGPGNYTEMDVKEAARALTGWTFRGNDFVFERRAHDPGGKTFLGRSGKLTGDDIIDAIFDQPAASRFIARKLFIFFAHESPREDVIEALAAILRENHFQVRPLLRQLFQSEEFYSPRSRGNHVKSPVELVVGTLRLLKVDPGESPAFAYWAGQMGQDIFLPPSVKGWDGGESWISTSTLFARYNFPRPLLGLEQGSGSRPGDERPQKPGERRARVALRNLPRWDVEAGLEDLLGKGYESLRSPEIVDRITRRLLLVPLPEESRKKLLEFMEKAASKARFQELINLVLSSPEYQLG
jgi:uncharacterized protein (DUF1800 family)